MRIDYHMHLEYEEYEEEKVEGFIRAGRARGLNEIGISEHTHTFPEFEELYYSELKLDSSEVGQYQKRWLKRNKFKHTLKEYFELMKKVKAVKIGIEVCNFKNQRAVAELLSGWEFDYRIGSVHFLWGWGFDSKELLDEWRRHDLRDIWEEYTRQVELIAASGNYDILGHPFNIRLFKHIPTFDTSTYHERVAAALKQSGMSIDVNTGTMYRYPVEEISPYGEFMKIASREEIPITINSDAHYAEDVGRNYEEAMEYVRGYGYKKIARYSKRKCELVELS